ncbi:membrane protein DedA with SNARE-associated domain [Azospirillum baldaniorum]|uniref:DedA family protein n=1 Tax=Azospirillum baldaniorum TaxID=1064539 RepID=UPI00119EBC04|nr:DedA family protein [Azospirillum baldaniorum]TWA65591.1 membrane protein DedA with SNARE-associated domain [Azospirillum baldaniorum]
MFEWITDLVESGGYAGIALLMLLENVFPPIPSELIMPLAGFVAARGDLSLPLVVLAGTVGSVAGALVWYYAGLWLGSERLKRLAARHGRWLTVAPAQVDEATGWFRRHSGASVLIGRLIPAVRTLISVPAGIAGMSLVRFMVYSTIGTALWSLVLAGAGYLLEGQYDKVSGWMDPVAKLVIAVIAGWYAYRVATFRPQEQN